MSAPGTPLPKAPSRITGTDEITRVGLHRDRPASATDLSPRLSLP